MAEGASIAGVGGTATVGEAGRIAARDHGSPEAPQQGAVGLKMHE